MVYFCLHYLKAAQKLIRIIQIHYCFGLVNNKLQTQPPFYYHKSFLRLMLDLRKARLQFEREATLCSDLHKLNYILQFQANYQGL